MTHNTNTKRRRGQPIHWGYCTRRDDEGRYAVGFVAATNQRDAKRKARRRVKHYSARVYVWIDPERTTAPSVGRVYTERLRRAS